MYQFDWNNYPTNKERILSSFVEDYFRQIDTGFFDGYANS